MRVANKCALVTGAASGMGAATARLLAREGAKVAVADMLEAEGRAVVAEITAAGGKAKAYRADISDYAQVQAMIAAIVADHGSIDVLVNNAGYVKYQKFVDSTPADWKAQIDTRGQRGFQA